MLLNGPQQFGLRSQGQLADLVQKYGTALRLFQQTTAAEHRSGKRPLDMAEQFAFEQRLRQCPAINGKVGHFSALADFVNMSGQQTFPRARFPLDQHRHL